MKTLMLVAFIALIAACEKQPEIKARSAPTEPSEFYTVVANDVSTKVGEPAKGGFVIRAAPGWKVNQEYPWKFEIKDNPDVTVGSKTIAKDAVTLDHTTATVGVSVTPTTAGKSEVHMTGRFSICNPDSCHNFTHEEFAFKVEAQ